MRIGRLAVSTLAVTLGLTMLVSAEAHATPPNTPAFPAAIDGYAAYDGQDTCDASAKPGVMDLRNLIAATYGERGWGIGRACGDGGQSEHKEGRALDYSFDINNAGQRAQADELLHWLLKTDEFGNRNANFRRLGLMYVIWNRQIFYAYRASSGWLPYSCNGTANDCHTNHIHFSFSWAGANRATTWWTRGVGISQHASIYGVLADRRLTYTLIDARSGTREKVLTSSATIGFTPKAMATLNFNTILLTNTSGGLYRVDVITNNTSLIFNAPVYLGSGWTHDHLSFDAASQHLYGIANGALRRYTVTAAKPAISNITSNTLIGTGFTLKTLTTSGAGWLLGTTDAGALLSYKIAGAGAWSRYELKSATWNVFDILMSPGGGVYYGRRPDGSFYRYQDPSPYDGNGDDLQYFSPVDTRGWVQTLLSAQPRTVAW